MTMVPSIDGRLASAVNTGSRFAATAWHAGIGGGHLLVSRRGGRITRRGAVELRERFEALGPTYVKFGQLIASSPGVFPSVLADEFQCLLDKVAPADPAVIDRILVSELGRPVDAVFSHFDSTPLASASIAQVHAGTLVGGEPVVVKIQRPNIRQRVALDTRILRGIAKVAELSRYGRMFSARDVVSDFSDCLDSELDFRNEAEAMVQWARFMTTSEFADKIRVPMVYEHYTTGRVLVMERIDGVRIDDAPEVLARSGGNSASIIKTLMLVLMDSIFRAGVFHGDLHAGNVLVDREGVLVLLDWGIVGRFHRDRAEILRDLVIDLMTKNDLRAVSKHLLALGAVQRAPNSKKAVADLRSITQPLATAELGFVSYQDLGKKILDLGQEYGMRLPRDLVLVAKQFLYVERYMKLLAPKWKPAGDEQVIGFLVGLMIGPDTTTGADGE